MIDDRRKDASANDPDLEAIAAAWRRLPADEPPELVDQAVLNHARRDLETARPRRLRWIGHFATAGVAVIAVSVWLLQDPAPTTPAGDDALRIAPAAESAPPQSLKLEERRFAPSAVAESAPPAPASDARAKGPKVLADEAQPAPTQPAAASRAAMPPGTDAERRTPDDWIEDMLALQAAGRVAELEAELEAFRTAYPDHPLPPALRGE
jgi:hypothetical protein